MEQPQQVRQTKGRGKSFEWEILTREATEEGIQKAIQVYERKNTMTLKYIFNNKRDRGATIHIHIHIHIHLGTATVPHGRCVLVRALPQCPTVAVSRFGHCHSAPQSLCLSAGTATVPHSRCVSVQALPQCPTVAVCQCGHCHSAPQLLCVGLGTAKTVVVC